MLKFLQNHQLRFQGSNHPLLAGETKPNTMTSLRLHQALSSANAYPDGSAPIGFRETHVSRLYLHQDRVYKLKKPVDFGFLNFTSLDRRRFYCQEEVRLNARFAPETYLGVVEVRNDGGQIRIDGQGEIIDYAVVMRRLPEERMLDTLLAQNARELPARIDQLAARLVQLHHDSAICRHEGGQSNLEIVRANWRENFQQAEASAGETLIAAARLQVQRCVEDYLEQHAPLLLQREADGWVRDGHGDLHAEHICLTEPICIYDCIEFNRRFRVADLSADLAFLLMDLDHRGRPDLAQRLLRRYRELDSEAAGPDHLLHFYRLYRAFVRGKVAAFLANDPEAETAPRQAAASEAREYFNLVLGYLAPPALILVSGLMGVGKSTLAAQLAGVLGGLWLRSDQLRKSLAGLPAGTPQAVPFGRGIYRSELTRRTYGVLATQAGQALARGQSVVADASFAKTSDRRKMLAVARKAGVPLLLLQLHCPPEVARERLDQRQAAGSDPSDGRSALQQEQLQQWQEPTAEETPYLVDTTLEVDYNVQLILSTLLERAGSRR